VLSYELGAVFEPTARRRAGQPTGWPLVQLFDCPAAYVHDQATQRWYAVGDSSLLPELTFSGQSRPDSVRRFACSRVRSLTGRRRFEDSVERAVEYIRAGDVFQANIAHHLSCGFQGSPRALFGNLVCSTSPWYGAYLESPAQNEAAASRIIASVSPELFLEFEARTRRITTRPIKGTRRAGTGAGAELLSSEKDAAELAMIVDLMRNDLGRVCEFGSIRVDEARAVEAHAARSLFGAVCSGLLHTVGTVSGTVRADRTLFDLLAGAFPPGSVTGAPKIRAMQIIDELEPRARGPYCGAIGYISTCGNAAFSVAIRTALLHGRYGSPGNFDEFRGRLRFPVGAGIVADSDPAAEWRETLHKASSFLRAVRPSCEANVPHAFGHRRLRSSEHAA